MEYRAFGGGSLVLKKDVDIKKVEETLETLATMRTKLQCELSHIIPQQEIDVLYDGGLDEDDIRFVLTNLTPYVESGEIEFEGEDSTFWRLLYDNGRPIQGKLFEGGWYEQQGSVVYDHPTVSDLLMQLAKKTGATVEQLTAALGSLIETEVS